MKQVKQAEWYEQWKMLEDDELFLFLDWIYPYTLNDFKGKDILECGCGGGQHTAFIAPYANTVTAVDLNTTEIALKRNKDKKNVEFIEDDIAEMEIGRQFDIVFSIGVVHHTDNPDKTIHNLKRHTKPGGKLILWVYSEEGNFLLKHIVELIRRLFLKNINRKKLLVFSKIITLTLYVPIFTIYLMPFRFLPYYEYFKNFRTLSFYRNTLNVFDKLNAPQVEFISKNRIEMWLPRNEFKERHVSSYKNVSWRASGVKRF